MSKTPQAQADELVEDFALFDSWEDRYRYLIDLGRKLPPLDESHKTEDNRVRGCQSNVWLVAHPRLNQADVIEFEADSDAHIVKGLIALLERIYSGQPAKDILAFDAEEFFNRLGLSQHLSLGRRNGLFEMVKRIKTLAAHLDAQAASQ